MRLMRIFKFISYLWVYFCISMCCAQSTTVSVTVTDSTSQAWVGGTISYVFQGNGSFQGQYQWQGVNLPNSYLTSTIVTLDGTGSATFSIPTSTTISPSGSGWNYTICPNATIAVCQSVFVASVGSTQNISTQVNAVILPIVISAQTMPKAYTDSEIRIIPNQGSYYYNVLSNLARLFNGSSWSNFGGGSGGTGYFIGTPTVTVTGSYASEFVPIGTGTGTAVPRQLTQDDILPGFSISSFNGGGTVEIGATVTNPSFTASYSSTPASANITNTDSINSPFNLTSPFTSATITGSFSHSSATCTTFTLTAISSSTRTATRQECWDARMFAGLGAAGASSTVTASGTNAVLSTSDVLSGTASGAGLFNSAVGVTFGPYTASNQKYYLLLVGNSHTSFTDTTTGFAFVFNTPTAVSFTNVNGSIVSMYLYESTFLQNGAHTVLVNN